MEQLYPPPPSSPPPFELPEDAPLLREPSSLELYGSDDDSDDTNDTNDTNDDASPVLDHELLNIEARLLASRETLANAPNHFDALLSMILLIEEWIQRWRALYAGEDDASLASASEQSGERFVNDCLALAVNLVANNWSSNTLRLELLNTHSHVRARFLWSDVWETVLRHSYALGSVAQRRVSDAVAQAAHSRPWLVEALGLGDSALVVGVRPQIGGNVGGELVDAHLSQLYGEGSSMHAQFHDPHPWLTCTLLETLEHNMFVANAEPVEQLRFSYIRWFGFSVSSESEFVGTRGRTHDQVIAQSLAGADSSKHENEQYSVFTRDGMLVCCQRDTLVASTYEPSVLPNGERQGRWRQRASAPLPFGVEVLVADTDVAVAVSSTTPAVPAPVASQPTFDVGRRVVAYSASSGNVWIGRLVIEQSANAADETQNARWVHEPHPLGNAASGMPPPAWWLSSMRIVPIGGAFLIYGSSLENAAAGAASNLARVRMRCELRALVPALGERHDGAREWLVSEPLELVSEMSFAPGSGSHALVCVGVLPCVRPADSALERHVVLASGSEVCIVRVQMAQRVAGQGSFGGGALVVPAPSLVRVCPCGETPLRDACVLADGTVLYVATDEAALETRLGAWQFTPGHIDTTPPLHHILFDERAANGVVVNNIFEASRSLGGPMTTIRLLRGRYGRVVVQSSRGTGLFRARPSVYAPRSRALLQFDLSTPGALSPRTGRIIVPQSLDQALEQRAYVLENTDAFARAGYSPLQELSDTSVDNVISPDLMHVLTLDYRVIVMEFYEHIPEDTYLDAAYAAVVAAAVTPTAAAIRRPLAHYVEAEVDGAHARKRAACAHCDGVAHFREAPRLVAVERRAKGTPFCSHACQVRSHAENAS